MSFAHPYFLFFLLIPALLMYWVWRHEGGRIVFPFDHVADRRGRLWSVALRVAETLPALLLAVVIVILAGPQQVGLPVSKRSLTNIQFCIDVSGSMTAKFGSDTRYDASMEAITDFVDFREGDAFGLTFFGNAVVHWVPLTSDASAIKCAPPFMHPMNPNRPMWLGGTEIGKALLACREVLLEHPTGDRMIILISDGYSADLDGDRTSEIARKLSSEAITVYCVHIAEGGVPPPISTIASMTGGEVFNPGDPEALRIVFARIDEMEKARLENSMGETMDHFFPYCMAGLTVLGTTIATLFGGRHTPW